MEDKDSGDQRWWVVIDGGKWLMMVVDGGKAVVGDEDGVGRWPTLVATVMVNV